MAWVKGTVFGVVHENGNIAASTRDLRVIETQKPGTPDEAVDVGLDLDAAVQLQKRKPGTFAFTAHFGGATAMLAPFSSLVQLDDRRMRRLYEKYFGPLESGSYPRFPEDVAIMHVRNTGAPVRQNDAEPSGGMAETLHLLAEQVKEMVEMGIVDPDGPVLFLLPSELAEHQDEFDEEQRSAWNVAYPDFAQCPGGTAALTLLDVGQDQLNGHAGILSVGPVGDVALTSVAHVRPLAKLPWRFLDLESHNGKPLHRHMVAIAPRPGKSPVVFQLNRDGIIDDFGHHFVLDGENLDLAVTHIGKAVLEALGWVPMKEAR